MASDVRRLLRTLHLQAFNYRDFTAARRSPGRRPGRDGPLSIALVSLVPSVGRTTICANLRESFLRRGISAAAIDLGESGRLTAGYGSEGRDTGALWDALASFRVVLLDTETPADEVVAEADEVLVVVRAATAVRSPLDGAEALLARTRPGWTRPRGRFLINAYDARRERDRGVAEALRKRFGTRVMQTFVHEDAAVRDATSTSQLVADVAPASQVVHDLAAISRELIPPRSTRRTRVRHARVE